MTSCRRRADHAESRAYLAYTAEDIARRDKEQRRREKRASRVSERSDSESDSD